MHQHEEQMIAGVAEPDREEIQHLYGKPVEPLAILQGKVGCVTASMQCSSVAPYETA